MGDGPDGVVAAGVVVDEIQAVRSIWARAGVALVDLCNGVSLGLAGIAMGHFQKTHVAENSREARAARAREVGSQLQAAAVVEAGREEGARVSLQMAGHLPPPIGVVPNSLTPLEAFTMRASRSRLYSSARAASSWSISSSPSSSSKATRNTKHTWSIWLAFRMASSDSPLQLSSAQTQAAAPPLPRADGNQGSDPWGLQIKDDIRVDVHPVRLTVALGAAQVRSATASQSGSLRLSPNRLYRDLGITESGEGDDAVALAGDAGRGVAHVVAAAGEGSGDGEAGEPLAGHEGGDGGRPEGEVGVEGLLAVPAIEACKYPTPWHSICWCA